MQPPAKGPQFRQLGFADALRNAHGRAPRHLDDVLQRTAHAEPHLAYGLRNSGEEKLAICAVDQASRTRGRKIEEIEVSVAMREAYPGAVYQHQGQAYAVTWWGRDRETKAPYINMVPARDLGSARTKPISRRVVTTGTGREHVVDRRRNVRRLGEIAHETGGDRVCGGIPGPSGAYPAVLPGAGGESQLLKETVALPVLWSPSPDQGTVVRRGLW